jgi:hypothetical protein
MEEGLNASLLAVVHSNHLCTQDDSFNRTVAQEDAILSSFRKHKREYIPLESRQLQRHEKLRDLLTGHWGKHYVSLRTSLARAQISSHFHFAAQIRGVVF